MIYTVYILRTSANTLYVGQTNNLEKRLATHKKKNMHSSKYMRYFKFFELVYQESVLSKSEALKREWQIKKFTKAKKETLIKNYKTE